MIVGQAQAAIIGLVLIVITHAAAYVIGRHNGTTSERAQIAAERAAAMAQVREAEGAARAAGERLAAVLARRKTEISKAASAKVAVVQAAASESAACLSAPVVATLNDQPASGSTSEQAAAQWMADAQAAHQACREQVIGLTDWIETVTKGQGNE
jgi:hypothetical protein